MDELALREQGETGERVCVLAARQSAQRSEFGAVDLERCSVAPRPRELLGPRRHQLAMPADYSAVGANEDQRVVECSERDRASLIDADDNVGAILRGGFADPCNFGPRKQYGCLDQLLEPGTPGHRVGDPRPIGIARDESLGKYDELGAVCGSFPDSRSRQFGRRHGVEKNRGALHCGGCEAGQVSGRYHREWPPIRTLVRRRFVRGASDPAGPGALKAGERFARRRPSSRRSEACASLSVGEAQPGC